MSRSIRRFRVLFAPLFTIAACVGFLSGCGGAGPDVPAGATDAAMAGDAESIPEEQQTLAIAPPVDASEVLTVRDSAWSSVQNEDLEWERTPQDLRYADPTFSIARNLPDGMTRDDLVSSPVGADAVEGLPCDVNEDGTLPEGYSYLVVDVSIENPVEEKVEFPLYGALAAYDADAAPGIAFANTETDGPLQAGHDAYRYTGEGAYAILPGAAIPLWASGNDTGTYDLFRDLWVIPEKRFQLYYAVAAEDLTRSNLTWLASYDARSNQTYAYRVTL